MASATSIEQIYDLKTIGAAKVVVEVNNINDAFARVIKTKKELNAIKDKSNDPATIKKVTTEIEKQTTAQASNVVKMNQAVDTALKLAYVHKELELEIKNVVEKVHNETDALNAQNKAELAAIQAAGSYSKASKLVGTETETTTKKIVDQTKAIQEAKIIQANNTKELKNQIREELNAKGSLEQRRAALIRLNTVYDRLSPKERDTAWGLRLQKTIQAVDLQVKGLEGSTGRAQRNVGNYASAFDKVSQSASKAFGVLRTVANILPGFGIGGLIGLGVEGLIALADAMHILETTTEAERKQIEFFTEEQKKMVTSIAGETATLKTLYETATNVNLSYKERGEAVDELIKQYPEMFNNGNREKLLNGELSASYDILTKSITKRAEAAAKQNVLTKLYEEQVAMQIKLDDLTKANKDGTFYYSKESAADLQTLIDLKGKEITAREKSLQVSKEEFGNDVFYINEKVKAQVAAQLKIYELRAKKGDTTKEDKKDASDAKKAAEAEKKVQSEREKIVFDAKVSLLSDEQAELLKLHKKHEEDLKKLEGASAADKLIVEEAYQKEKNLIQQKYMQLYFDTSFENEIIDLKNKAKIAKKKQDDDKKNWDILLEHNQDAIENINRVQKIAAKNRQDQIDLEAKYKENNERAAFNNSLQLAQDFAASQIQISNQRIDKKYDEQKVFLDTEKERQLAQAQTAVEKQAIEEKFAKKQSELEKQRNIEHQKNARKQATIEFGLASIRAISEGLKSGGPAGAVLAEALVLGQYLIALKNINSQKFEQGGQVPTSSGGDITGPSHAQGGVPFAFEAQGGEMAIINKNSTMDKGTYNLTGTPRQIASAINTIGGGVQFAPGALTRKFEYGGLLGSNLSAPVFRSYYQSQSGGVSSEVGVSIEALRAIAAMNYRIDNLQVVLNPHAVTKAQNDFTKQAKLGTI